VFAWVILKFEGFWDFMEFKCFHLNSLHFKIFCLDDTFEFPSFQNSLFGKGNELQSNSFSKLSFFFFDFDKNVLDFFSISRIKDKKFFRFWEKYINQNMTSTRNWNQIPSLMGNRTLLTIQLPYCQHISILFKYDNRSFAFNTPCA
jgi:hypothetical protein